MTAQIIQLRDYKRREERQAELARLAESIMNEALFPTHGELFEIEATTQSDSKDCA